MMSYSSTERVNLIKDHHTSLDYFCHDSDRDKVEDTENETD